MAEPQKDLERIHRYLQNRDEQVLQELLNDYLQLGFSIIYRVVRQREEAEDVLQEALVKVIQGLPNFQGISSFKTWFCKICYHESINRYKKNKSKMTVNIEDLEYELHEKTPLDETIEKRIEKEKIWNCVDELDPRYKTVLMAFYQDEMSIKEIAQIMKLNENTIKTHLSRAKSQLKSKLGNYTFD